MKILLLGFFMFSFLVSVFVGDAVGFFVLSESQSDVNSPHFDIILESGFLMQVCVKVSSDPKYINEYDTFFNEYNNDNDLKIKYTELIKKLSVNDLADASKKCSSMLMGLIEKGSNANECMNFLKDDTDRIQKVINNHPTLVSLVKELGVWQQNLLGNKIIN